MDLNQYQQLAMRTKAKYNNKSEQLLNGLMGLCGESGEAMDMFKKAMFQGHRLDEHRLEKELGDILWYVALSADALGLTLEKIAYNNIEKLKIRYPNGFSAEDSLRRVDEN